MLLPIHSLRAAVRAEQETDSWRCLAIRLCEWCDDLCAIGWRIGSVHQCWVLVAAIAAVTHAHEVCPERVLQLFVG
jgi:hypothetical protein